LFLEQGKTSVNWEISCS